MGVTPVETARAALKPTGVEAAFAGARGTSRGEFIAPSLFARSFLTAPTTIPLVFIKGQAAFANADGELVRGAGIIRWWKPHSCRSFEPPFASDCAFDVLRGSRWAGQVLGALDEWLIVQAWLASIPAERQRSAAALRVGWRCTAPSLLRCRSSRSLAASKERNSGIQALICPVAGIRALRSGSTTLRASLR